MTELQALQILERLNTAYPNAECELHFDTPFHLLVSVILSAQCTDVRVNKITPKLFSIFNTPQDFAVANAEDVEKLIYSCGFYHTKTKSIISASNDIVQKFGGNVPSTFEELLSLQGVGRKTANVVMSVAFGGNNIAVDTHVFRTSKRLGLSGGKTPREVEDELCKILPPTSYSKAHHLLIFFGRYCCKSQRPDCANCPVYEFCTDSPLLKD